MFIDRDRELTLFVYPNHSLLERSETGQVRRRGAARGLAIFVGSGFTPALQKRAAELGRCWSIWKR